MSINTNKYGSLVETMVAFDLYNLPMPVTPPADLNLAANLFSLQAFGTGASVNGGTIGLFDRRDNPYINSFGFFSNMADGLVDAVPQHNREGFNITTSLYRLGVAGAGITNTPGSATVTGTDFEKFLAPGMTIIWRDNGDNIRQGTIASITNNTTLLLTAATANTANSMYENPNNSGNATTTTGAFYFPLIQNTSVLFSPFALPTLNQTYGKSQYPGDVSFARPISGKITFVQATAGGADTLATGFGTKFSTEVDAGQYINYIGNSGVTVTVLVVSVDSDTRLTIKTPAAVGSVLAGVAIPATKITVGLLQDGWMDDGLGLIAALTFDLEFYTITIDPGFASKQLSFHAVAEIEHTFPMVGTI